MSIATISISSRQVIFQNWTVIHSPISSMTYIFVIESLFSLWSIISSLIIISTFLSAMTLSVCIKIVTLIIIVSVILIFVAMLSIMMCRKLMDQLTIINYFVSFTFENLSFLFNFFLGQFIITHFNLKP